MAYEFKKLSDVPSTETTSDACNVLVEDGGEIKKTSFIKTDDPHQQLVTGESGNAKWEDRTHYEEDVAEDITGNTYVIPWSNDTSVLEIRHDEIPFELGQVYTVYFKDGDNITKSFLGEEVKQIVDADTDVNGILYIGSGTFSLPNPFIITHDTAVAHASFKGETSFDSVELVCTSGSVTKHVVHQLDQKFIPNSDWNINDPTKPGYIKNRICYESFNPLIEQVTVSCTTALTEIEGYAGKTYYGFGSMQEALTASSTFEVIYDGTRYVVERHALSDHISINSYNFVQYVGDPYLKEYPFAIEFNYEHNTVFTKTSGEHTFVVNTYNIKQIDPKFIDGMYYDNSQHISEGIYEAAEGGYTNGEYISQELWSMLLTEKAVVVRKDNGATYQFLSANDKQIIYKTEENISDEPSELRLIVSCDYPKAYFYKNVSFDSWFGEKINVTASIEDIHKIDQKFIPPQTVYVNATGGDVQETEMWTIYTNVILDKTYDEIYALLSRSVDVQIIRENVILNCLNFNEEVISFLAYYPFDEQATLACAIRPDNSAAVIVGHLADSFLSIDVNGELVAPLILKSSTPGSNKKFKISVDDSGAVSATEV